MLIAMFSATKKHEIRFYQLQQRDIFNFKQFLLLDSPFNAFLQCIFVAAVCIMLQFQANYLADLKLM